MQFLRDTFAWKLAHRAKHSDLVRALHSAPQAMRFYTSNRQLIGFDVTGRMGMGAMLTHLVLLLRFVEQQDRVGSIRFTNGLYSDFLGENWLPRYFRISQNTPINDRPYRIQSDWDYKMMGASASISLAQASEIFHRRVQFTAELNEPFQQFIAASGMSTDTLAVHFRGTDKAYEAALITQDEMLKAVRATVEESAVNRIYLATDEPAFEGKMVDVFGRNQIISYRHPDLRSDTSAQGPIHFSKASGSAKAIDALVNIRLLASCSRIVRTASYMSGWAKVLNPEQSVMMLNKLDTSSHKFPDTEIAVMMKATGGGFSI